MPTVMPDFRISVGRRLGARRTLAIVLESAIVTGSVSETTPATTSDVKHSANLRSIGMVFLCTVFGAAAQILMKHGANHLTGLGLIGIITNLPLMAGYFLYGVNTVLLVLALREGHLSVLYPVIAFTYVWVTILSRIVFLDFLNAPKVIGVALIVAGVSLIGKGSRP